MLNSTSGIKHTLTSAQRAQNHEMVARGGNGTVSPKYKRIWLQSQLWNDLNYYREYYHITSRMQNRYSFHSQVYRILNSRGLITSPAHIFISAGDELTDKTKFVHQMWQTDFTYFKIIGWGQYYLSTVLDDYSRYIVHWEL